MKKLIAVLLVALMLISAMPMSAFAAEVPETETPVSSGEEKQPETTIEETTAPVQEETEVAPDITVAPAETETTVPEKEAEEPIGAKSDSEPLGASSFTYTVSNNQVTITGLTVDTVTDLVIPDTIEDMPVVAIKENAFNGCSQITSITVPNSVTSIGNGAFKGTKPTKVTLPFIGNKRGQTGLSSSVFGFVFGTANSSTSGTIGQKYYSGNSDCVYCYMPITLKEVEITDETVIPYGAFNCCVWLEKIVVNDSVSTLSDYSFGNCTSLLDFSVPDSVKTIGLYAFYNCSALKSIDVPDTLTNYSGYCFCGCSALESISFPSELKNIGDFAFQSCTALTDPNLIIPNKVTSIGNYAFKACSNITSITVPNSVTSIGNGAFMGTQPTKVTLPFIGIRRGDTGNSYSVFGYIFGVTDTYSSITTQQNYSKSSRSYYFIPKTIKEVIITDETVMPYGAFSYCNWIERITVNVGPTYINGYAFYYCTSLTSFSVPNTVTSIGEYAFYNCKSLKSIDVPDSLKYYNNFCFKNCTSLEIILLPSELTSIGESAFDSCTGLTDTDLVIPNKVTTIGKNAFNGCAAIKSITVPKSVTDIYEGAFKGTQPTKVTLPFIGIRRGDTGNSYSVFGYIFGVTDTYSSITTQQNYSKSSRSYYFIPKTIKEVVITDESLIPYGAFDSCSWFEKVYINDIEGDASLVGNNAFFNCKDMTVYINRDTAVHTYCERNGIKHCSTKSITLDSDSLVLFRNETGSIDSEVILLNGNVDTAPETVWSSSNTSVATVDKNTGLISAVSPGTAIITADSEGVTATAEVTVYFKLEGIALNKTSTEIDINNSETLTVIYSPDNTTDSRDITWKSSNDSIATVDENGTVTAVKKGKATITATGANGVTASCTVQVLVPITEVKFESGTASIPRSTRQKVPFTISPSDYTDTYTVTSSDTDVATVDKFGNVVARKVGTAVITVTTSRGLKDECIVIVYSPATAVNLSAPSATIYVNRSVDLTAELSPSDCTDGVTWSSSDDSIVEVDNNGKVTGISKGVATITATADSGVSAECVVTVESDINITSVFLEYNEIDYNGEDKTPEVYVYFNDERLIEDTDYSLYYYNNHDAGEAGVIVTSLYDGTEVTKNFTINRLTVTALDITCKTTMVYTGGELKAVENITYNSLRLAEGIDYEIKYDNNINVGKATATITGKGNFVGPTTRTFNITAKPISETTITLDSNSFRYDGKKKTPKVTVRDGNRVLVEDKDYSVAYNNNINAGEATVVITGMDNYGSFAEKKFTIEKRSISETEIVLSETVFLDDGTSHCPTVTVNDGETQLEQGVDYDVEYKNNVDVGIATVIVSGKNNYSGSISDNFEILMTGDLNNDGRVDILDATVVQKYSAGKADLTDNQIAAGDVNNDGVVDILDAAEIQKFAAGKITEFKKKA